MKTHRYTELIAPMDRYLMRLTPAARKLVSVLEGGLLIVLFTSVIFYLG